MGCSHRQDSCKAAAAADIQQGSYCSCQGSLAWAWPALEQPALVGLCQLQGAGEQLAALSMPALPIGHRSGGYQLPLDSASPALYLKLQLPGVVVSDAAGSLAEDTRLQDACEAQLPEDEPLTFPSTLRAVADSPLTSSLLDRLQCQYAADCALQGTAALLVTRLNESMELELEASGGGTGSDGCGEDGGEGGGASW